MESLLHQLQKSMRDKDAEIEQLKRERRNYPSKIKELEDEVISLRNAAIPTRLSSMTNKQPPTLPTANLPPHPSLSEGKQQPISILADLPARPKFTGFDTPAVEPASEPSLFAHTASPQVSIPQPTPLFGVVKPASESTTSTNLPTWPGGGQRGNIPPLLPHDPSYGASQMPLPADTLSALFQNFDTPSSPSGATEASTLFNPAAVRTNSYFHGLIFDNIPVPQSDSPPSSNFSSFNFKPPSGNDPCKSAGNVIANNFSGNMWEKEGSAPPSTTFNLQTPPAGTTLDLRPSNHGTARSSFSGASLLFGNPPPRSATSINAITGTFSPFGDHLGSIGPWSFGNSPSSTSLPTFSTPGSSLPTGRYVWPNGPSKGAIPGTHPGLGDLASGARNGPSPIFGKIPVSSARSTSTSTGSSPLHLGAANVSPSSRAPLADDLSSEQFHASQLPPGLLPGRTNLQNDEARLQETLDKAENHAVGNKREGNVWPVTRQSDGDPRWL